MRYSYSWPAYIVEYPWDFDADRDRITAESWCAKNISNKMWSIKKRTDKFGMMHVTFWFQKKEDLVLFRMVFQQ